MGLFGVRRHATIHVEFLDYSTGKVFAQTDIAIDRLPKSFEAETTMHIRDVDWHVIEARPMTAVEFARTGKLLLIVQKVTTGLINPSEVLFSLPTITNDALPPIAEGSTKLGADVIEIHEDDWRQIEWISASSREAIAGELDAIRAIYEHARVEVGFKECHLRLAVPDPLRDRQPFLADLRQALGPQATWLSGFTYQGVAGIVESSFAIRLISSIEMYGVVGPGGSIQRVCFANTHVNNAPLPDVHNLVRFAAAHDLILVDWCRVAEVEPTEEAYAEYFIDRES